MSQANLWWKPHTGRLIGVVGPSGSGKSSLVRAGVFPRLRQTRPPWVLLSVLRPADRPVGQLARAFTDAFARVGAERSSQWAEQKLGDGPPGLVALANELSDAHPGDAKPPVLVFVDQAEELVTPTMAAEHAQLLELIDGATRGPGTVWALLTLRSEFLSVFLQAEGASVTFDDQLLVGPLDAARLAEVIERPADRAGVGFAPGLVGRMVADTGGGDALPLLAHTLAALHGRAAARDSSTVTIEDYQDLGGVVGALRRTADDECQRLSERGLGELVIPTLKRLATLGSEGQATRRRLQRASLTASQDEIVAAFIEARLLTSTDRDGQTFIEVAHEALLRQWPPLVGAIDRDREALRLRSELERAATDWEQSGRLPSYLLPRARLLVVQGLSADGKLASTELGADERAFLAASEQRQRASETAKRRRGRRFVAGLVVALVVVSALAVVAVLQSRQARSQRDTAQATLLATSSLGELGKNPSRSLELAMQAYAKKHTSLTNGVLRVAVSQATPQLVLHGHIGPVNTVAFAPDGRHLASGGADGTVRVWDSLAPHTATVTLRGHASAVNAVAFAGDGHHLASAAQDGTVRVWDWSSPRQTPVVLRNSDQDPTVWAVAFTADGKHVAGAGGTGVIHIWDWRAPDSPPVVLNRHGGTVLGLAFASDGHHLASAGPRATVQVWDTRAPRRPPVIRGLRGSDRNVVSVAFASDGIHVAGGNDNGAVGIWNWRENRPPVVLRGHVGRVVRAEAVAFTPDGRYLASGGQDGTVRVWEPRASTRAPVVVLRGDQGAVAGVAFARDGRRLAGAAGDATVRLWDWQATRTQAIVFRHDARAVAFAPDGVHLATAGQHVRVWDLRAPRNTPIVLDGHGDMRDVAFASDGRHLATAGYDGKVRVWDWRSPSIPPVVLTGHQGPVYRVTFSADAGQLASLGQDATVRVWRWRTPRAPAVVLHEDAFGPGLAGGVAFADDGSHVVTLKDNRTVRVVDWRAPTAPPVILSGQIGNVLALASANDERHVAAGGDDGTVRVWDWRAPRDAPTVLRDHQGLVFDLAFASDGRHLANADGEDGTLRIWDWREPRAPPTVLSDHRKTPLRSVLSVAFSPDATHIASAGEDSTTIVQECQRCGSLDRILARGLARLPRNVRPK